MVLISCFLGVSYIHIYIFVDVDLCEFYKNKFLIQYGPKINYLISFFQIMIRFDPISIIFLLCL